MGPHEGQERHCEQGLPCKRGGKLVRDEADPMHASTRTLDGTAGESESLIRATERWHTTSPANTRSKGVAVSLGVWESQRRTISVIV